jgi:hypothetical protein
MNVTCVGGDCGFVNGTLRYNNTNGIYPDTPVSNSSGATPFYVLPLAFNGTDMEWVNVTNTTSKFSGRYVFGSYVFNNSMWVVGGYNSSNKDMNDVWYSRDGANWTNLINNTPIFMVRESFGAYVFNNSMWVVGGYNGTNGYLNDVWYSGDGANWTQVANTTSVFGARYNFGAYVFNNSMWVVGGTNTTNCFNDIWYSSDGANWTQVANTTPVFSNRSRFGAYVFNNSLWVIGGYDYQYNRNNDVWRSNDGANWTQVANTTPVFGKRHSFGTYVYNNSMWVIGGWVNAPVDDVWYSNDGANWTNVTSITSKFGNLYGLRSYVFNNSMWVVGGYNNTNYFSDVWKSYVYNNPQLCGSLTQGQTCQLSWTVNATGSIGTQYWLDSNFTSNYSSVPANDSGDFQINITDTKIPNIAGWAFNVSNMTNYSSTQGYQFNATVIDNVAVDKVWIEHNFTGTLTNYTVSNVSSVYYYNYQSLAAGYYYVKWYANDSSANLNNTDYVHYYQVNKSYLPITFYINGTDGDNTLFNNSNANFTANFSSSYSMPITLYTNLTGSWTLWDTQNSPLRNYTVLNPYQARTYLIIANFSNQNYTYSQANHTLTLNNYGWLNVSYQSPATGNSQKVSQYDTFNVSINVTCVGGSCGSVTGVLRYNNSAGLNPDTNVSTVIGATPFYAVMGSPTTFAETNISDTPVLVNSVTIGDSNNDGQNEVVVGLSATNNELRMYENKTGGWRETNISDVPNSIMSIAVGDANNDGYNDVIIGTFYITVTNELRMYSNVSGGWVETNISDFSVGVNSVAIGDANRDGQNEVVVGLDSTTNEVRMYKNETGTWVETNISDEPSDAYSVAIGDANNDGKNEVVIGIAITTNELRMYENKTGSWIETSIRDEPNGAKSVAIGDANRDGQNEVVVGMGSTTNEVRMYKNETGTWVETNISDESTYVKSVAIGDANRDGQNEVVIGMLSAPTTNELRMYENKSGAWVETNISDEPNHVYSVAIGDANRDGKNEVIIGIGASVTNEVRMYELSTNPLSCGALSSGQTCTLSWTVNATGTPGTQYWLDTNFTSSYSQVPANDSGDFQVNITDGTPPNIVNLKQNVSNMSIFSATQGYQFNATVTDNGAVDDVWIQHNFTGTMANYTVTTANGNEYYYNFGMLPVGYFQYRWWANDTFNNVNGSELRYYQVNNTAPPNISFVPPTPDNGSTVIQNSVYVNVSTNASNPGSAFIDWNRSLVAWYRFNSENDFTDYSSYGNNGTNFSSTYNSSGKLGGARRFDGINDVIDVGSSSSLKFTTSEITVEAWIKIFGDGVNWGRIVLGGGVNSAYTLVKYDTGDDRIFWRPRASNNTFVTSTSALTRNEWHYIVGTYNASASSVRLYIDGILNSSVADTGNLQTDTKNVLIGGENATHEGSKPSWFDGLIDEVRIHRRTLSPEEISASYNAGTYGLYHNFTGLSTGNYTYIAYAQDMAGNLNQTETRTVAVVLPGWLNVSYQSPANGSSQNVNQSNTFNVSMNVTCVGGPCGNVTGVLRYNKSSSVPDAAVEDPPFQIVSASGNYNKTLMFEEFQNLSCGAWSECAPSLSFSCSYGTNPKSYCAVCSNDWNAYLELKFSSTYCTDPNSTIGNKTGDGVPSPCAMVNGTTGNIAFMWLYKNVNIDTNGLSLNVSAYMRNYVGAGTLMATKFFGFRGNVTPCSSARQSGACANSEGNTSNVILSAYVIGPGDTELPWTFNTSTGPINGNLNNMTIGLMTDEGWAFQAPYAKWDNVSIIETVMTSSCGVMTIGQTCQLNWTVKATGSIGNQYWLDSNFTSNYSQVPANDSGDFQINITDGTPPNIATFNFNISNMTNYSSTQGYQFNATVIDNTAVDKVWIEHNFTGTLANYTVTTNVSSVYYYNYQPLAAGYYYIKWYANDSYKNLNNTDWVHYYQVNKSWIPISLYINGTNGDMTLFNNSNANFTANFSSSYAMPITLYTNLTGTMALWDTQNSPLRNYTVLNQYQARTYLIKANFSNQNYTYSQANHTLTLNNYGWLNVSYQSPVTGNSQKVNQYDSFNVSMNVTCVGGDCGSVSGVLRYNSTGSNPDTTVSSIIGATPFYAVNGSPTTFAETNISFSDPSTSGISVAIGDVNNDGKNEVVAGVSGGVELYQNISGTWVGNYVKLIGNGNPKVAIGDANNDGLNETVIGMATTTNGTRMYENKSGSWVETNISDPGSVRSVAVGDANNDGKNEVVIGMQGDISYEFRMYENKSGGWVETNISDEPQTVYSVAIGDTNNDGQNEVVVGIYSANGTRMYKNTSGSWVETNISRAPPSNYVGSVAIGDANNDGKNETVVGGSFANQTRMYQNISGGWVETNISNEPSTVLSVAVGDANNDGQNEVVVGLEGQSNNINEVRMYQNTSGKWVETNISDPRGVRVNSVTIGDSNNDGKNEVVIGGQFVNGTRMYVLSSNSLSCWSLYSGQTCALSWIVNATGTPGARYWLDSNFTSNYSSVPANDSGDFQINITTPELGITLVSPPLSSTIFRYRTFDINVTVTCLGGSEVHCNDVMGYAFYNLTSNTVPNVRINTTAGDVPFYNFSGANPYSCPNLASGQSCNYSISVNATGGFQSEWLLNVTFNSTQLGLPSNSTPNFKLVITSITGCNSYYNCNSTSCLSYNDEIITIQTADATNKAGSRIRRCWS